MSIEAQLRTRIDTLLDDRWTLTQKLDEVIGDLNEARARLDFLERENRRLRKKPTQLHRRLQELRRLNRYYREAAYRARRSREMWRARAQLTHEERRERDRARRRRGVLNA